MTNIEFLIHIIFMQICESRLEKVIGSGCEEFVADEARLCQYIYTVGNVAHIIAGQLKHSTLLLIQNLLIDDSLFKEADDDGIFNKLIIIVKPTYKKYLKLVIKHFLNSKSLCQLLFYFYSYRTIKLWCWFSMLKFKAHTRLLDIVKQSAVN